MALNSNFVINRIGFKPVEALAGSTSSPIESDKTYTSSRLGLTFVRMDQPDPPPPSVSSPMHEPLGNTETQSSRIGIAHDTETDQPVVVKSIRSTRSGWIRPVDGMCWFLSALWEGVWADRPAHNPTESAKDPCEFMIDPVPGSLPTPAQNNISIEYRKGTYKMPSELIARLRAFSAVSHQYQYRLVMESLNEFLAAHGYPSGRD